MNALENPRYHMWIRLIPGYEGMDKNKKKWAKKIYVKAHPFHTVQPTDEDIMRTKFHEAEEECDVTLDHCYEEKTSMTIKNSSPLSLRESLCIPVAKPIRKKECAMYAPIVNVNAVETTNNDTQARRYLYDRAYSIYCKKDVTLRQKFGTTDQPGPKTPQELVDRIKSGNFIIQGWEEDQISWETSPSSILRSYIRWRDPSVTADMPGLKAALILMETEYTKLKDSIAIKTPVEALAELQAWEVT